jgi:hypothetical protein
VGPLRPDVSGYVTTYAQVAARPQLHVAHALNPKGRWVPHVIAAIDERITHLPKSGVPDPAGLVLASDQNDARAYADIVERVTAETPAVIVSDDPRASTKIEAFAADDQRMAVCVRMISEGIRGRERRRSCAQ